MDKTKNIQRIVIVLLCGLLAFGIAGGLYYIGNTPQGTDTIEHLYGGNQLYESIREGVWFPLHDSNRLNGIEPLRYAGIIPLYLLAFGEFLTGGGMYGSYLLYVWVVAFLCLYSWTLFGKYVQRPKLSLVLGMLWFCLPNNLFTLLVEGDLPRALCNGILPLVFLLVYRYMTNPGRRDVVKLMLVFAALLLSSPDYAGMILGVVVLYLVIWNFLYHRWGRAMDLFLAFLLDYLLLGIWIYNEFVKYPTATRGNGHLAAFFQSLLVSLNPFNRVLGSWDVVYIGIGVFLLGILGAILSHRPSLPGFWTAVILFLGTTTFVYPLIAAMPGGENLRMLQFVSIGGCLVFFSLLLWSSLKRKFLLVVVAVLLLDTVLSLGLFQISQQDNTMLDEIMAEVDERTIQRLAFLGTDVSDTGTTNNMAQLNQALADGAYDYVFDRCLELGNDTVLVGVELLANGSAGEKILTAAAEELGYVKVKENAQYLLYQYPVSGYFGVVSSYNAIGIGSSAGMMSLLFPALEETSSANLNDYTFEELKDYETIYLAGFTYEEKESAEELILNLAEAGVHIIIDGDGIPSGALSQNREFLGVTCNDIQFENGYPILYTTNGTYDCNLFARGYSDWQTVYFTGLDQVEGYFYDNQEEIRFFGTAGNENITFIGLNLGYHYALTHDPTVGEIYGGLLDLTSDRLPQRTIVPLDLTCERDSITIISEVDDVNTTLAYLDCFQSEDDLKERNHLLYVGEGTTTITFAYPNKGVGGIFTFVGLVFVIPYLIAVEKRKQ